MEYIQLTYMRVFFISKYRAFICEKSAAVTQKVWENEPRPGVECKDHGIVVSKHTSWTDLIQYWHVEKYVIFLSKAQTMINRLVP